VLVVIRTSFVILMSPPLHLPPNRASIRPMRLLQPFALSALISLALPQAAQNFTGRWNFTGTGEHANRVYWLEVTEKDGQLSGLFLHRTGSPLVLDSVRIEDGQLVWRMRSNRGEAPEHRGRLEGDKLVGTIDDRGASVAVVGVRPPRWPAADANAKHTFGKPVALFDGTSMDAFRLQHASRPSGWSLDNGAMTNTRGANNLISNDTFQDFRLEAEYKVEAGSNSGLYLRGRYELQVLDDHGKPPAKTGHMAIYGWTAPLVNASKPAGEWQSMEAILVGNRVSVTLNGQKVHDNAEIQALTGGALDANETAPGPLLIQGDHNRVWYRRILITPITASAR
jgi:hypothetical protein